MVSITRLSRLFFTILVHLAVSRIGILTEQNIYPRRHMKLANLTPSQSLPLLLQSAVESYVKYFADNPKNNTHQAKRYDLKLMLEYLAMREELYPQKVPLAALTHSSLQGWIDWRLESGDSAGTVVRRLANVKHFCSRLAEMLPGFRNPARELRAPVVAHTKTDYLTQEAQAEILAKARTNWETSGKFADLQIYVLIKMMLRTGLRLDEVRSVKMSQIDGSWLRNVKCKGRKFRDVYLSGSLRAALDDFFQHRHALLKSFCSHYDSEKHANFPIFVSQWRASIFRPDSFRVSACHIWRRLQEVDSRLHPHLLRHTFAKNLVNHTKDIALVSQALGHSDVRVTMRYTDRSEQEIAEAIESMAV